MSDRRLSELKQRDDLLTQVRTPLEADWERRGCERSLLAFTHAGWRWAGEPGKFVDNWHIECMCEHLEAVANRQILRLLINVPPRHYKSMGLNVFFPRGCGRKTLTRLGNIPSGVYVMRHGWGRE
jgi:hypothetical protein